VYPYLVERSPFLIDVESVVAASINISCTVTPLARASLNKVLNTSSGSFTNVPAGFFFWISLIWFSFWFNRWWWFQPVQLSIDRKVRFLCAIFQRVRNILDAVLLLAGC
jgi:hypothetical protein